MALLLTTRNGTQVTCETTEIEPLRKTLTISPKSGFPVQLTLREAEIDELLFMLHQ